MRSLKSHIFALSKPPAPHWLPARPNHCLAARWQLPALLLAALLLACLAAVPAHAACTSPAGNEGALIYNQASHTLQSCNGTLWAAWGPGGPTGGSGCSSPAGHEGDLIYNQAYHTYQFCNDTNWIKVVGGVYSAPPSGSGYFVVTKSTWTGNLGDSAPGNFSAANALCLTELTTNTGWQGYASAHAAGYLISANVKAFLCDDSSCNNLTANTTYYFANANNANMGGASFTTDGNGDGPNNSTDWTGPAYFGGEYQYWTGGREEESGTGEWTQWQSTVWSSGVSCNDWASASASYAGEIGDSDWLDYNATTTPQWGGISSSNTTPSTVGAPLCTAAEHLICYVNP